MFVCDLFSHEADARGDVTRTLQQCTTQKGDTMRASDKMDSCNIRSNFTDLANQHSAHRRTRKQQQRYTRLWPWRLMSLKPHESRCSVQRSSKQH